jgi:DNA-binding MarR family transcriptional regulator
MDAIPNKDTLVENALTLVDKLVRQILPSALKDLLTLDITMTQTKIMLVLYLQGPTRMSDIASGLDVTLPTATSLVERLVEKNYALRETILEDRRVVLCKLSEAGQEAISRIWQSSRSKAKELLESIDMSKLELFAEAIQAMYEAAMPKTKTAEQS